MAEGYETEDEQVEALKKWWRENGKSTVIVIVVSLAGVFGWQGWQKQQLQATETASGIYQNMIVAAAGVNGTVTEAQRATAGHLATTLKNDFSGSTYAIFAALYKAKLAVADNKLSDAESELRWVLDKGPNAELVAQTKLRLARVLSALDKYDDALAQLQGESASVEEVRGDIYVAKGDKDKAAAAYDKALTLNEQAQAPVSNPLLQIKIQQLKSEQGKSPADAGIDAVSEEGA